MNKKPKKNLVYCIAYLVLWVVFRIVMPTRCINKQNRPRGGALLCANHTRTNDPLFIAYALGWRYQIHVMAKEEIMHWPFIGWVLRHGGIFGVKRGKADVTAIKTSIKYLKNGELLLMFPEGTRHQDGDFATQDRRGHAGSAHRRAHHPHLLAAEKDSSGGIPWCSARHTIPRCRRGASPPRRTTTPWRMI